MKKIIVMSILFVLTLMHSSVQAQIKNPNDSLSVQKGNAVSFRLFTTQNMWTFIKLNTRNGQMWQVQFNMKDENRFETSLSLLTLVTKEKEVNDRFFLYPTQNMYTFILLDQLDGRTWQVQWSTEAGKRFIIPIE